MLKKHISLEGEIKGILEKELLEIGLDVGMRQIIHRFPLVGDFSGMNSNRHNYRTRAIIGRSRFEAALVYKPQILGLKNEEFLFLVHKLSVI